MKRQLGRVSGFISGCESQSRDWWPSHSSLGSIRLAGNAWKNGKRALMDPSVTGSCSQTAKFSMTRLLRLLPLPVTDSVDVYMAAEVWKSCAVALLPIATYRHVCVGACSLSQAKPHLEDDSAYRQNRPTAGTSSGCLWVEVSPGCTTSRPKD